MKVTPIKTPLYKGSYDLHSFIFENTKDFLKEKSVLAITTKIVSLSENRVVSKDKISKLDLVKQESEAFLGTSKQGVHLTLTQGILIPSAGIDESNSESGDYILYPKDPYASAKKIGEELCKRSGLKDLGVILTDSRSSMLRRGVTGFSLAHWGFRPLKNFIGSKDLFGRSLKATLVNLPDSLAGSAVLMMGESAESQPLALIEGLDLEFMNDSEAATLSVRPEDDLYAPVLNLKKISAY